MFNQVLGMDANLGATVIRADGTHRDIESLSRGTLDWKAAVAKAKEPMSFWKRVWADLRDSKAIPVTLTFGAFIHALNTGDVSPVGYALVTTAGVNYMAADFLAGSSARINAFNYHDCGEGDTAANIADTTLEDPFGGSRVSGTQSNPSANQYRSVATIPFSGTFAITEFGLFSASTSGTLWDRRVFSEINVSSGDSISFQYTVTVTAGGS